MIKLEDSPIASTLETVIEKSNQLALDRQELLRTAANAILDLTEKSGEANLLFVCTHNSRRSHLADLWAKVTTAFYEVEQVECYSCGTEATACNPRTISALQQAGFMVEASESEENPVYRVSVNSWSTRLYSKAFGDPDLPTSNLIAMLCCDDADQRCPTIPGAEFRVALHYRDPKESDDTPQEQATYHERSLQIGAEMCFLARQLSCR